MRRQRAESVERRLPFFWWYLDWYAYHHWTVGVGRVVSLG
ncbi:unnamed protein product [Ectocarpus fasciculatus]